MFPRLRLRTTHQKCSLVLTFSHSTHPIYSSAWQLIAFEISIVLIREGMAIAHEGETTPEKPKALEAQA